MRDRLKKIKSNTPKIYDSFREVECLKFQLENSGEFKISLKCNDIRVYKLEYYLNDELIKPENLQGKNLAYKRWSKLISKMVESSPNFVALTPENCIDLASHNGLPLKHNRGENAGDK